METRADNSTIKWLLEITEMKILTVIAGYTLFDHKRNENIREICKKKKKKVPDTVKWARSKRREWRVHVSIMPNK